MTYRAHQRLLACPHTLIGQPDVGALRHVAACKANDVVYIPYGWHTMLFGISDLSAIILQPLIHDELLQAEGDMGIHISEAIADFLAEQTQDSAWLAKDLGESMRHWLSMATST